MPASRDLRIVEGAFDDIIAGAEHDERPDDYLLVRLTDKKAILDTLSRLRAAYPNVLHLEKPGLDVDNDANLNSRQQLKRSAADLFADFFEQTQGEALSDAQKAAVDEVIEAAQQAEADSE